MINFQMLNVGYTGVYIRIPGIQIQYSPISHDIQFLNILLRILVSIFTRDTSPIILCLVISCHVLASCFSWPYKMSGKHFFPMFGRICLPFTYTLLKRSEELTAKPSGPRVFFTGRFAIKVSISLTKVI